MKNSYNFFANCLGVFVILILSVTDLFLPRVFFSINRKFIQTELKSSMLMATCFHLSGNYLTPLMIMDLHGLVIVKTTLAILLLQLVATKCVVLFPPSKANFNFM